MNLPSNLNHYLWPNQKQNVLRKMRKKLINWPQKAVAKNVFIQSSQNYLEKMLRTWKMAPKSRGKQSVLKWRMLLKIIIRSHSKNKRKWSIKISPSSGGNFFLKIFTNETDKSLLCSIFGKNFWNCMKRQKFLCICNL